MSFRESLAESGRFLVLIDGSFVGQSGSDAERNRRGASEKNNNTHPIVSEEEEEEGEGEEVAS